MIKHCHIGQLVVADWNRKFRISLRMPVDVAAAAVALRSALDAVIVRSTSEPETVSSPPPAEAEMMNVVRELSRPGAAGSEINPQDALMR